MKKNKKKINAAILIIGNEILSGRTQDLNVSFLTNWLNNECGISVYEVRIIPDLEKKIIKNILELKKILTMFLLLVELVLHMTTLQHNQFQKLLVLGMNIIKKHMKY